MRFRRGLSAVALAASLGIVWTAEAQASQTIPIPVSQWAYADSGNLNITTTDSFVGPGDPSPAVTIMRSGNDTMGILYRGFLRFPLTDVSGQILDVRLAGRVDHTWACSARPNYFYRTAPITVTPRQSWPGPALQLPLGSQSLSANEAACSQPNQPFELFSTALLSDIQAAVNAHQTFYYVGVAARDFGGAGESNQDRWMRYFVNDFRLLITFEPV